MNRLFKQLVLGLLLCSTLAAAATRAQQADDCTGLVLRALEATSQECLDIGRNEVCYGNVKLTAEPRDDVPADQFVFDKPGDRVKVELVKSLRLNGLNTETGEWGVGYMRIRANLPDVAAGQFVTVILFGDTEIRDASVEMNARNGNEAFSPMQAFYFRTGIGDGSNGLCSEFPTSGLLIQTPKGEQKAELVVNEVRLSVGSTILLEAPGDPATFGNLGAPGSDEGSAPGQEMPAMTVSVFEGAVEAEIAGEITTITTGEAMTVPLDENMQPAGEPVVSEAAEDPLALYNLVIEAADETLIVLEGDIPTPPATEEPTQEPTQEPTEIVGPPIIPTPTSIPTVIAPPPPPPPPAPTPTPAGAVILSGSGQAATVNSPFSQTMKVKIVDSGGNPVSGVQVQFTAPASEPTLYFVSAGDAPDGGLVGAGAAGITVAIVTTDGEGVATSPAFAAGLVVGTYNVQAHEIISGAAIQFSQTNVAGAPGLLTVVSGDGQSATVGTAFGTALQARITDAYGNPLSGLSVTFTAPASGASGTFAGSGTNTISALSNASGLATATTFTANGAVGAYSVAASFGALSPAMFNLSNTPGAPAIVNILAGNGQSVVVGSTFPTALQVEVRDSFSNPVPGVGVMFTAPGAGASGTFAATGSNAEVVATNGLGVATASAFTANTGAGGYLVNVSAGAANGSFSLTNQPGAPASIVPVSSLSVSLPVGTTGGAFVVQVFDAFSNPVPSVNVTFTAPVSGASGTFAGSGTTSIAVLTDSAGFANSTGFTSNTLIGPYTLTATYGGPVVNFSVTNTPGVPALVTILSGDGQIAAVNTAFAVPLQVMVWDAYSNPVPGATVTFTAPPFSAGVIFALSGSNAVSVLSDSGGVASSGGMTANSAYGIYNVTATSAGATGANFTLTNLPPPNLVLNTNDSGLGSLRDVVAIAAPGAYIDITVSGTITLTSGEIVINKSLTIAAVSPGNITVSGNNASRIFNLSSGTLTLVGVNLAQGNAFAGGAILVDSAGVLNIFECLISNSTAAGGGGLYSVSGGVINVSRCAFQGNSATSDAGGGMQTNGPTTITNSTFTGNWAGNGGAISVRTGNTLFYNNTFVGNTGAGFGGIEVQTWTGGTATIYNSIVANNSPVNCGGTLFDGGGNVVWGDSTCPGINANPNYGGLTGNPPYFPLLPPSPAENLGIANCPATDQRGVSRGVPCDAGAYEVP